MIYPWQVQQWHYLLSLKTQQRLPQALLFIGQAGIGKSTCAQAFIQRLLCQANCKVEADNSAMCHSCHLIKNDTHPNVLQIFPEGKSQTIKIEQVRDIIPFVAQSSLAGNLRFVVIHAAHEMNLAAANALLKTLEEPANGAMLILLTTQPGRLPATIISRCQRLTFTKPETKLAVNWLEKNVELSTKQITPAQLLAIANGAPLHAKALLEQDNLFFRQQFFNLLIDTKIGPLLLNTLIGFEKNIPLCFDLLLSWLLDILRLQLGADSQYVSNQDFIAHLSKLASECPRQSILNFIKQVQAYRQQLWAGINLNKQLLLENILITWMDQKPGCRLG